MSKRNPSRFSDDTPLFNGIVQDLFPGVETPVLNYGDLQTAIEAQIVADGLQKVPVIITKIIQLYETKNSRHSVMIVGDTGLSLTCLYLMATDVANLNMKWMLSKLGMCLQQYSISSC